MAAPAPPSPNEPKSAGESQASSKIEGEQGLDAATATATATATTEAAATTTASTVVPPTYANTKNSESYATAKAQLNGGDFEGALSTVESALKAAISLLPDSDELHESLAPLYYLYGTTLLYSIEESTDSAEASVMVQNPRDQDADAADASGERSGGGDGEDGAGPSPPGESAEDLEIAWENLDAARAIVSRIVTSSQFSRSSSTDPADAGARDVVLDLAQIHTRLGDLQCANGNYGPAVSDFEKALGIRTRALGPHDRRVADVHYRLGTTCVALAAEGEKASVRARSDGGEEEEGDERDEEERVDVAMTPAQIAEHRERAVSHFLSCARSLGGIIGKMCGRDPDEIAAIPSEGKEGGGDDYGDKSDSDEEGTTSGKSKGKATESTSADDQDDAKSASSAVSVHAASSAALRVIRERVSDLRPLDLQNADAVSDLRELLDEIQEAIDTAREDLQSLRDVSEMKARAEADAGRADRVAQDGGLTNALAERGIAGAVTTVGFGAAAPVSSVAAAAPTASAPMMIVKKKKKRDENDRNADAKRAKTE